MGTKSKLFRFRNAIASNVMHNSVLFGVTNLGGIFLSGGDVVRDVERSESAKNQWASPLRNQKALTIDYRDINNREPARARAGG